MNRFGKRHRDEPFSHAIRPYEKVSVVQPPAGHSRLQGLQLSLVSDDFGEAH
jgi:hypothetical protein